MVVWSGDKGWLFVARLECSRTQGLGPPICSNFRVFDELFPPFPFYSFLPVQGFLVAKRKGFPRFLQNNPFGREHCTESAAAHCLLGNCVTTCTETALSLMFALPLGNSHFFFIFTFLQLRQQRPQYKLRRPNGPGVTLTESLCEGFTASNRCMWGGGIPQAKGWSNIFQSGLVWVWGGGVPQSQRPALRLSSSSCSLSAFPQATLVFILTSNQGQVVQEGFPRSCSSWHRLLYLNGGGVI